MWVSIRNYINGILRNSFVQDVTTLSFGVIGGRLIMLLSMPLAARLYSPDDFALLAVYLGVVSTLAVPASLRLDVAIPLAENKTDAAQLMGISLLSAFAISAFLLLIVLLFPTALSAFLGQPDLARYLWLVPLGVLLSSIFSTLQYWTTRAHRFDSIARSRITQAVMGAGVMLSFGWFAIAPLGLLLGSILSVGAGGLRMALLVLDHDRKLLFGTTRQKVIKVLRNYSRYPLYSMPEGLINVAGVQVPVIFIAAFSGAEAGFLFLAMQIMTAPMTLLGHSIGQVYMSRVAAEAHAGRLAPFTLQVMVRLVQVGVGPLLLAGLISPIVFPLIFGAQWGRAGEIVTLLVPWMVLQFIASPVSMVMYVVGRQRAMMTLTSLGAVLRIGGVLIANTSDSFVSPVVGFILGSVVYYVFVFAFVCSAADFKSSDYLRIFRSFLWWPILLLMVFFVLFLYMKEFYFS